MIGLNETEQLELGKKLSQLSPDLLKEVGKLTQEQIYTFCWYLSRSNNEFILDAYDYAIDRANIEYENRDCYLWDILLDQIGVDNFNKLLPDRKVIKISKEALTKELEAKQDKYKECLDTDDYYRETDDDDQKWLTEQMNRGANEDGTNIL